ncbi:hypothetical protein J2S74_000326 [Evansella vedderi]|uniref:Uncharacterized protein n=1 Tax=Evansella vedderi TaxID=38282 RepID=A0ABT9ZQ30_9BACI|nr:hypothetical protein [Evansella vedderi]
MQAVRMLNGFVNRHFDNLYIQKITGQKERLLFALFDSNSIVS